MIPDYQCNVVYFSEWLKKDYPDIFKGLVRILNKHNVAYDIIPNTKDVWCRDYMPLQLDKERYRWNVRLSLSPGTGMKSMAILME